MQENSRLARGGAAPNTQYYNDDHLTKLGEENEGFWRAAVEGPNSYGVLSYLWLHSGFRCPLGQTMETNVLSVAGKSGP